jgi:hypothetical protein
MEENGVKIQGEMLYLLLLFLKQCSLPQKHLKVTCKKVIIHTYVSIGGRSL